jgi:hypothetical protein
MSFLIWQEITESRPKSADSIALDAYRIKNKKIGAEKLLQL